jgi:type VI secretion system secreted protein Hcp
MSKLLQAAIIAALALPCTAAAAVDYFLKIEGIPGESKADGHKDEIDVASWSWGASASSPSGSARASSRPCPSDIVFTKLLDKASPLLAGKTVTGTPIAKATLTARKAGEKQQEYLKVEFTDILVSSYQTGGASQSLPMESVSFNFSKMTIEYKEQRADGSVGPSILAKVDGC